MERFHNFYGWIIFHCVWVYNIFFFIQSSIDGHLGCFSILTIVNNTAMNMDCIYLFHLMFSFSSDKYQEVTFLDHKAVLFLIFRGTPIVPSPIYIPTYRVQVFLFLPILTNIFFFFDNKYSEKCEVILHYGFYLYLPND